MNLRMLKRKRALKPWRGNRWSDTKDSATLLEPTVQVVSAPRSCTIDEGRPLGADLQELASNHLKLLWSNARVVSVKEKAPLKVSGEVQGGERKRTTDEVSKRIRRRQNWGLTELQDRSKRDLLTAWAASGIKVART